MKSGLATASESISRWTSAYEPQFNVEFLNALNRVVYTDAGTDPTNASFGKVTSQNNLPRDIQLAAKIVF